MAQSLDISTSRFSNWSQHLDFSLFRLPTKQAASRTQEVDLGIVTADKLPWKHARGNPVNWPKMRKGIHLIVPTIVPFICSLAGTIITPAIRDIGLEFRISPLLSTLPYALYILGLSIGSFIGPAISELCSRKLSLLLSLSLFSLSQLGIGLSRNVILTFGLRFVAGLFGAIGSLVAISIVFDMYHRHQRTIPYIVFFGGYFLGPAFGPVAGSYIAHMKSSHWAEFAIAISIAPLLILTIFMRDTCAWRIYNNSNQSISDEDSSIPVEKGSPRKAMLNIIRSLFTEPSTLLLGLWLGVIMGIQYAFYSTLPPLLSGAYHLDWLPQSLCFLSLGLGSILGLIVHFIFHTQALPSLADHWHSKYPSDQASNPAPQLPARYRLLTALPVTIILPMVVIFFAFTVLPDSSIFISLALLALFGTCSSIAFLSGMLFLTEIFNSIEDVQLLAGYFFVVHTVSAGMVIVSGDAMGSLGFKATFGVIAAASALLGLPVWGLWIRNRHKERHLQ